MTRAWLSDAPIRRKLTAVIAATSILALLLAAAAIGLYEIVTYRRTLAQKLTTAADIVGRNSTAALTFGDKGVAKDILAALGAEPSVESAVVFDRDGRTFAAYLDIASSDASLPTAPGPAGTRFEGGGLVVVRPIVLDAEPIGTVYVRSSLAELWRAVFGLTAIMVLAVIGSALVALAVSARLQHLITAPMLALAATARQVTGERNFSLRAERAGRDEVGRLVDDFNRMLGEIEHQHEALRRNQEQLEAEVRSRTTELVSANERLVESMKRVESHADQIAQLTAFGQLLQSCQSPDEMFRVVEHALTKLFPDDSGAVFVLNASRNLMEAMAAWGPVPPAVRVFGPDECWAYRLGHAHLVADRQSPLRCVHLRDEEAPVTLCVPMTAQGDNIGVLQFRFAAADPGGPGERGGVQSTRGRLAQAVAEHVALALANLRLREALQNQSIVDSLTGLFNRRYLEKVLERECRRALRAKRPLSVIMIDVDHFKRFNDMWGHDGGDAVLKGLAALMRQMFRGEDVACRYGGEEFVVLLAEASLEAARVRAEALRRAVHGLAVEHRHRPLGTVSISAGVATLPEHGDTPETLVEAADRALYAAKAQGRDRTVCASVEDAQPRRHQGAQA